MVTSNNHNHESDKTVGFSIEVQDLIKKLFDEHYKPKTIRRKIAEANLPVPTKNQLAHILQKLKKTKFGRYEISLGELTKYCEEYSAVPEEQDEAFVLKYEVEDDDDIKFRFLITTKRLLSNAKDAVVLLCDATYKLMWQGFPVLVHGTTDSSRQFHHIGISVSSNEATADFDFVFKTIKAGVFDIFQKKMNPQFVIADAAHAIGNVFSLNFADGRVIMCWAHERKT
jgi:hypothetical protein